MLPSAAPGAGGQRGPSLETPMGPSTGPPRRDVFDTLGHSRRQRDIFPLPPLRRDSAGVEGRRDLSRVVRRRGAATKHILDWGDDCIDALNGLYGHPDRPAAPANAGQQRIWNKADWARWERNHDGRAPRASWPINSHHSEPTKWNSNEFEVCGA